MTKITLVRGDITEQNVDAIVNAANSSLMGGFGVDGAIHQAAGPKLKEECEKLGGCELSEAKITKGYNLPAKFVIHTVGPVFDKKVSGLDKKLAECYTNCLKLAYENGVKTIAFPSISTGVFRYPAGEAAKVATKTVNDYISNHPDHFEEIHFVAFDEEVYIAYAVAMNENNK